MQDVKAVTSEQFFAHHLLYGDASPDRAYKAWLQRACEVNKMKNPPPNTVIFLPDAQAVSNFHADCLRAIEKNAQGLTSLARYAVLTLDAGEAAPGRPGHDNWEAVAGNFVKTLSMFTRDGKVNHFESKAL